MADQADGRLTGRVAIITGAGDGIGAATAMRFADEGARLVVSDRSGKAETLAARMGPDRAVYRRVDLTDAEGASALVDAAIEGWGRLDIVIANAGVMPTGSIEDHSLADFRFALEVNDVSTFVLMQAAARRMERGASIVSVASVQALQGHADRVGYDASKGALVAMTRAAAVDLAPRGIRVNAVCPATVDTPMYRDWLAGAADRSTAEAEVLRAHPLGRIGSPDDIASAILFLASDESSFITGVALPVDGGYAMAKT
jgi:NAD(P)-dependent dehydrogenase (short-subunit alcohol dehydrogenase family)